MRRPLCSGYQAAVFLSSKFSRCQVSSGKPDKETVLWNSIFGFCALVRQLLGRSVHVSRRETLAADERLSVVICCLLVFSLSGIVTAMHQARRYAGTTSSILAVGTWYTGSESMPWSEKAGVSSVWPRLICAACWGRDSRSRVGQFTRLNKWTGPELNSCHFILLGIIKKKLKKSRRTSSLSPFSYAWTWNISLPATQSLAMFGSGTPRHLQNSHLAALQLCTWCYPCTLHWNSDDCMLTALKKKRKKRDNVNTGQKKKKKIHELLVLRCIFHGLCTLLV